jgi:peptidoglycan/LPS O-acetylase OafA/YrhL
MNYRPEIDGLRAVAVVPVILFHAGFGGLHFSSAGRGADASTAVRRAIGEVLGVAGVALIGYAVFRCDRNTPYSSRYALVPTLGTALVIVLASSRTLVGRMPGLQASRRDRTDQLQRLSVGPRSGSATSAISTRRRRWCCTATRTPDRCSMRSTPP